MSIAYPLLFIGHDPSSVSCPDTAFNSALARATKGLPSPKAVLLLSCERVTRGARLKTLGDQRSHAALLKDFQANISGLPIAEDPDLTLDPWSMQVLNLMFPEMDFPVHILSIDQNLDPLTHYFLGKELKYLREKNILILALGNIIHNPSAASPECQAAPPTWASLFERKIRKHLKERNFMTLVDHFHLGPESRLSITESDHYLPLIYVLGAAEKKEPLRSVYEGFKNGTTSLKSFRIG